MDWLDARNICRRHCMDAVSLETPQENEFVKQRLARGEAMTNSRSVGSSSDCTSIPYEDLQPCVILSSRIKFPFEKGPIHEPLVSTIRELINGRFNRWLYSSDAT